MSNSGLYSTTATVQGGRDGKATSDDGHLAVDLHVPQALGGAGGPGTNPEQLFAAPADCGRTVFNQRPST